MADKLQTREQILLDLARQSECTECGGQGWVWRPIQFAVQLVPRNLNQPVDLEVRKEKIVCRCRNLLLKS